MSCSIVRQQFEIFDYWRGNGVIIKSNWNIESIVLGTTPRRSRSTRVMCTKHRVHPSASAVTYQVPPIHNLVDRFILHSFGFVAMGFCDNAVADVELEFELKL